MNRVPAQPWLTLVPGPTSFMVLSGNGRVREFFHLRIWVAGKLLSQVIAVRRVTREDTITKDCVCKCATMAVFYKVLKKFFLT